MQETIIYLDLTILVHTVMTTLLLLLVARLCRRKAYPLWLAAGVIIGLVPLLLWAMGIVWSGLGLMAMWLVFPVMIVVGLRIRRLQDFIRCFLVFAVLAALGGGGLYMATGSGTRLTLDSLWIIPVLMGALYGLVCLWQRWHKTDEYLQQVLFRVEMDFGWGSVVLPALLDTGNDLKDPITGSPVIVVEEKAVRRVLPPDVRRFLDSGWQKEKNPWRLLLQTPALASAITFVATESVGGKQVLPGIRPQSLVISPIGPERRVKEAKSKRLSNFQESASEIMPTSFKKKDSGRPRNSFANQVRSSVAIQAQGEEGIQRHSVLDKRATVLLVQQVLSAENRFQALLHPQFANLSGRNSDYVVHEESHILLERAGDKIHREMA